MKTINLILILSIFIVKGLFAQNSPSSDSLKTIQTFFKTLETENYDIARSFFYTDDKNLLRIKNFNSNDKDSLEFYLKNIFSKYSTNKIIINYTKKKKKEKYDNLTYEQYELEFLQKLHKKIFLPLSSDEYNEYTKYYLFGTLQYNPTITYRSSEPSPKEYFEKESKLSIKGLNKEGQNLLYIKNVCVRQVKRIGAGFTDLQGMNAFMIKKEGKWYILSIQ